MAPISNGYFHFSSDHQGKSSRGLIKAQGQVSKIKHQLHHQAIIGYSHSQYSPKGILAVHFKGIFKRKFQKNLSMVNAPSIHLGNHIHSMQSGFAKTCISFIKHGKIIQPSSFLNLARCIFHQTINTASGTQYRSAANLKKSSSQPFTYTSLL
ncbi:hypothetical protein O181_010662 [Austropuccinia psidii MF-1]|uniref:Uncharacterized protein n=1 Tax=Austropuccinia psidii MF-1 TaxID=1389203 RepID=A0A9Q3BT35_9BASI|nr:hypothetical protein [Austropuccinia psidii MF-1]